MSLISESVDTILAAEQVVEPVFPGLINGVSNTYTANAVWDFAVNGGGSYATVTPVVLNLSVVIPEGAIVYGVLFDITTAIAGTGATLAFNVGDQPSVLATAITNAPWSVGANPVQVNQTTATASTPALKLTADAGTVSLQFGVADATAGAMIISVLYVL